MNETAQIGSAKEVDHLLQAAKKRVQQCIGTTGGHRETLAGLRARVLGEHVDGKIDDEAPEPVRSDIEELFHQIDILAAQQDQVSQHIDALMKL